MTNAVSGRVSVTVGSADQPGRLAVGDGELWEVTYSGVPGAAVRIDPATLDVLQRISLQGMLCCTAAVSVDSLWLSAPDDNVVYRVDPASGNVIASIALPSPGLGVLGGGALWLISGNDVVRIDPAANTVSARIAAPEGAWVEGYAAGSVWLSTSSGLARLDPTTNKVTAQIPIPGGCAFFAFDGTSVWTSGTGDGHAGLWRIDASSNAVTGFVPLEPATRDAIGDVAVGAGAVWATLFGGIRGNTVVRVAPAGTMN
jgi:glutamine cyclotransferase